MDRSKGSKRKLTIENTDPAHICHSRNYEGTVTVIERSTPKAYYVENSEGAKLLAYVPKKFQDKKPLQQGDCLIIHKIQHDKEASDAVLPKRIKCHTCAELELSTNMKRLKINDDEENNNVA